MILVRSPLRITLGGGGTDLPSYYLENEGFLISASINKYVYVSVMKPFTKGIYLKYSEIENVKSISKIKHPIIRETLKTINHKEDQIEITTLADIPSGTGLGSSGSFGTALIKALHIHNKLNIDQDNLAEFACDIEMNKLKEPIGKQDQYISVIGGITVFEFKKNNKVKYKPLNLKKSTFYNLEDRLLLFFTGYSRSAGKILKNQDDRSSKKDKDIIENLNYVKKLGVQSMVALENNDIDQFGLIMNEHWENKKRRSKKMSNLKIDQWYNYAIANGALGGKLVGAGGGGFLMFLASDPQKLRNAMSKINLPEVRFSFDFEGTKPVFVN